MNKYVKHWLYAIISNYISGGAGAVTSGVTASIIAPDKFNLSAQLYNFVELVIVTFVVSGVLNAMVYLKSNPLPPQEDVDISK